MLTFCTECFKTLTIKDEAKGKKARCPHCKGVFVADEYIEPEIAEPEPEPPAMDVEVEDSSDADAPCEGKGADWSFGEPVYLGEVEGPVREDIATLHANAIAAMRPAAQLLLAAIVVSVIEFLINVAASIYLWTVRVQHALRDGNIENIKNLAAPLIGAVVAVLAFGTAHIFVIVAVRKLYTAGSRGLILTGIWFDFILLFEYLLSMVPCLFVLSNLFFEPNDGARFILDRDGRVGIPAMIMCGFTQFVGIVAVLGLLAGIRAIRALRHKDVKRYYYRLQTREVQRRRALEED